MARSILESLREGKKSEPQLPGPGQTEQIASLAASRASGRAAPAGGGAPRVSTQTEQVALGTAEAAAREQTVAERTQERALQTQATYQEKQEALDQRLQTEERAGLQENHLNKVESILAEQARSGKKLDFKKKQAKFEQVGTMMRLSNDEYIHKLSNKAAHSRLQNKANFDEALALSVFDQEQDLFFKDLTYSRLLTLDNIAFNEEMGNIKIAQALEIAEAGFEQKQEEAKWKQLGEAVEPTSKYAATKIGSDAPEGGA
jgi:hypothetical protein